jgi:hypothetical protein
MFAWNAPILTKQTITSFFITEKCRKVSFLSHDRVCDDRIRHLNHLRSLIVLSTKVNILSFCKFDFAQERRCHGSVKMTVLRAVSSAVIMWFRRWIRRTCLSWRCDVTRGLPLRGLSFVLSVCRRRIISLEMVIPDTLKWSATAWWVIPVIVLSTKVNILSFWKFEFAQERRCHGSVKMTVTERWVWFRLEWLIRPLQTTLMCLE